MCDCKPAYHLQLLKVHFSFPTPLVASSCPPGRYPAQKEPWCSAGLSRPLRLHRRARRHHPPHRCGGGWSGRRQTERGAQSRAGGNGNLQPVETKDSQLLRCLKFNKAYTIKLSVHVYEPPGRNLGLAVNWLPIIISFIHGLYWSLQLVVSKFFFSFLLISPYLSVSFIPSILLFCPIFLPFPLFPLLAFHSIPHHLFLAFVLFASSLSFPFLFPPFLPSPMLINTL